MRPHYIFHGVESEPHNHHVKSDWEQPVQISVSLETLIEEVKFELARIEFDKPTKRESDTLSKNYRVKKSIILTKSDKGSTTVLTSREDKRNEGKILPNDYLNNCRLLVKPMVENTAKKAQQLVKTLL